MHKHTRGRGLLLSVLCLSTLFTGCAQTNTIANIDNHALDYLQNQTQTDLSTVVGTLNELDEQRKEEELPDEPQIPEEVHLSAADIRAELANGVRAELGDGNNATGVLEPYKITTLSNSEIPKIRSLYSDTVIVGNSRAESIVRCGLLTQNEVIWEWAAHVDEVMDIVVQAANLYRKNVLFIFGVNDLGYYTYRTNDFKRDYGALIDAYREINPTGEIYIQEIIPVNEAYRFRWYNMDRVVDYNAVLRELCEEKGCTFVSSVQYAIEEFLLDDGAGVHYNYQYHLYWAQTMANQMGLWEEQK